MTSATSATGYASPFAKTSIRIVGTITRLINVARLVRHGLSHTIGRVTPKIAKQKHGLHVLNDELQIWPSDVKSLHDELKVRAYKLAEYAVKMPAFV
jgi:hypothetical protein